MNRQDSIENFDPKKLQDVNITLDGKTNGIGILLQNESRDFLRRKNQTIRLFKSLELAKVCLAEEFSIVDQHQYTPFIVIEDNLIKFDYVQRVSKNCLQFYALEGRYNCFETHQEQVLWIGYYIFDDGDTVRINDPKYGIKRNKELMKIIKDSCTEMIIYQNGSSPVTIDKISKNSSDHVYCQVKNSTVKVHFCYNSQVMDFNQKRKELDVRCLPFLKFDKYTTFYIYITKDDAEPVRYDGLGKGLTLVNLVLDDINEFHPELGAHLHPVEFKGKIFVD
jgi:hypothetical protein